MLLVPWSDSLMGWHLSLVPVSVQVRGDSGKTVVLDIELGKLRHENAK